MEAGAEQKQLINDYQVGAISRGPYKVSLLSGNVEERRLLTYLARDSRKDIQVLHTAETSAIIRAAPYTEKWRGR